MQSKVSRTILSKDPILSTQLKNFSPIGHMRITPPGGGIVVGQFIPGNVSSFLALLECILMASRQW